MRPRGRYSRVLLSLGAVLVLLLGILIGGHPGWLPSPLRSVFVADSGNDLVSQAMSILSRDYYRPLSSGTLADKSIAGAVAGLNDPYSQYYDPAAYRSFVSESDPHLSGVGIDVTPLRQGLRIVEVFQGSPAAQAGLSGGDLIVGVGSVSLANRSQDFGSRLIRGSAGTLVTLVVQSGRTRRKVTIKRANIVVPVASSALANARGVKVGVVRLARFTDGAGAEVRDQVQRVLHQGARALVLDLRANGGGLLDEAVKVASIFIADGTIVSTEGRSQPRQVYVARGGAISAAVPLVALVDKGTASSSEIVTAALRDRRGTKVVGTRTYGKGVFQELQTLANGGALEIVTGRWFEPSGRNVGGPGVTQGTGIQPDIRVADDPHGRADRALTVAEQAVAGQVR
ncbi:MAG: S41 family peptidase [Actinomycetota bacterium]|nr:S41 family peptidase [Actinomycetota bacterium]